MELEQLMASMPKSREELFYETLCSYKEQLYRIAYSYLKNEQDALEAIQETTCRAYMSLGKLKDHSYFKTWVIRILINYCIDEQKRKHKNGAVPENMDIAMGSFDDKKLQVEEYVQRLEPKFRQIIVLKYFEDMKINEIAAVMKKPEGTIKTWLTKALKRLKDLMSEEGEGNV